MPLTPIRPHERKPEALPPAGGLGPVGNKRPRRVPLARVAGLTLLAVVLAVAFMGHLTPAMRVQWANFVSLCGF